jgi:hypothetical protein
MLLSKYPAYNSHYLAVRSGRPISAKPLKVSDFLASLDRPIGLRSMSVMSSQIVLFHLFSHHAMLKYDLALEEMPIGFEHYCLTVQCRYLRPTLRPDNPM